MRVLNYNEKKVQNGFAKCIYAANFLKEAHELSFYEKLFFFKHRIELNQRAQTNMLHISLNFHPSEKLSTGKLNAIASSYIEKIGFSNQPFLVYQHHDAGHPHVHIITTSILQNGKRIDTFNIGKTLSENARKEIEKEFSLLKAEGRQQRKESSLNELNVQSLNYGKSETKRSITNVLLKVLNDYKYSSLNEVNAVLKLFNVTADRGSKDGRIYKNGGLVYRIIDSNGQKIGVPVKASSIYFLPTLSFLEKKFTVNDELKKPYKSKLKGAIDFAFTKKISSISAFVKELQKEQINVALHRNDEGFLFGITFIDHRTQCVFKGSELGKSYTASGIKQRLSVGDFSSKSAQQTLSYNPAINEFKNNLLPGSKKIKEENNLIQILLNKESIENSFPAEFLKKKKKRRKNH